jgi:hypothetical protein
MISVLFGLSLSLFVFIRSFVASPFFFLCLVIVEYCLLLVCLCVLLFVFFVLLAFFLAHFASPPSSHLHPPRPTSYPHPPPPPSPPPHPFSSHFPSLPLLSTLISAPLLFLCTPLLSSLRPFLDSSLPPPSPSLSPSLSSPQPICLHSLYFFRRHRAICPPPLLPLTSPPPPPRPDRTVPDPIPCLLTSHPLPSSTTSVVCPASLRPRAALLARRQRDHRRPVGHHPAARRRVSGDRAHCFPGLPVAGEAPPADHLSKCTNSACLHLSLAAVIVIWEGTNCTMLYSVLPARTSARSSSRGRIPAPWLWRSGRVSEQSNRCRHQPETAQRLYEYRQRRVIALVAD